MPSIATERGRSSAVLQVALLPLVPLFMPQLHIGDGADPDASAQLAHSDAAASTNASVVVSTIDTIGGGGGGGGGGSGGGEPPSRLMLLSPSIVIGLLSIALSGTIVGTLDPTLSIRLSAPPFKMSPFSISLFFFFSSVVYVCVSTPIGWQIDRMPNSPRLYKLITMSGFATLFLTFFLLAPFGIDAFGATGSADPLQRSMNNLPCAALALGLKGVGSALSNNAIYPDLVLGVPDDPMIQALISSLWNAAYAVGWAAGPLVGGMLMEGMRVHVLCIDDDARAPNCPAEHTPASLPLPSSPPSSPPSPPPPPVLPAASAAAASAAAASAAAATLSLPSQEASFSADAVVLSALNCSCEWQPDNGFDGFASAISLACLVYAFVLVVAAALNWRGPNSRYLPGRGLPDELAVQPLDLQVEFDPSPMRDARSDSTTVQPLQVVPPLADLAPTFGRD